MNGAVFGPSGRVRFCETKEEKSGEEGFTTFTHSWSSFVLCRGLWRATILLGFEGTTGKSFWRQQKLHWSIDSSIPSF